MAAARGSRYMVYCTIAFCLCLMGIIHRSSLEWLRRIGDLPN